MSMTDPIADMLTRIRNALMAGHTTVNVPGSNLKQQIAEILKREGYIDGYTFERETGQGQINIQLRWVSGAPAIDGIHRLSKPGQRKYARGKELPTIRNGLGICIISTSRGLMTDRAARRAGVGGELICSVW